MTSHKTSTTSLTTTSGRRHTTRRRARRHLELRTPAEAPIPMALAEAPRTPDAETIRSPGPARLAMPTPPKQALRSAGRFVALAANPLRARMGVLGGFLTALLAGGIWALLTWVVAPGARHVNVQTPFGSHSVTVASNPLPWAIVAACLVGTVLVLIAGIRLQLMGDRERG